MYPTAESRDLLGVRGCEVDAATASDLVLAVRVHGAGRLVYGLVDDVVLQLWEGGSFVQNLTLFFCDTIWVWQKISFYTQYSL